MHFNPDRSRYPGMITKVPDSIDIISADTYTLPQYEANMDRRLYNGWSEFRGGASLSFIRFVPRISTQFR